MAVKPLNPQYEVEHVGVQHSISYPSEGPVMDRNNRPVTNGHSTLTKVLGKDAWMHNDHHRHDGSGRVHLPIWHARDLGLPTPDDVDVGTEPLTSAAPGSDQQPPTPEQMQPPSDINASGSSMAPRVPAAPSKVTTPSPDNQDKLNPDNTPKK